MGDSSKISELFPWNSIIIFFQKSKNHFLYWKLIQCGIYINESASAFTKEISMSVLINSQQFKIYTEELFTIGSQLKTKKIREFFAEGHKDREVKLDLSPFTQSILTVDTKQLWGVPDLTVESYYAKSQPIERKYPKRIIVKECVINAKKISV